MVFVSWVPLLGVAGVLASVWLVLRPRGAPAIDEVVATGAGRWQAKRLTVGGVLNVGQWGVLEVSDGTVSFTLDGEAGPAWSVPARQLAVGPGGGLSPSRIRLTGAEPEPVTFDVSRSEGARWRSAGDVRGLADAGAARALEQVLLGWGARRG